VIVAVQLILSLLVTAEGERLTLASIALGPEWQHGGAREIWVGVKNESSEAQVLSFPPNYAVWIIIGKDNASYNLTAMTHTSCISGARRLVPPGETYYLPLELGRNVPRNWSRGVLHASVTFETWSGGVCSGTGSSAHLTSELPLSDALTLSAQNTVQAAGKQGRLEAYEVVLGDSRWLALSNVASEPVVVARPWWRTSGGETAPRLCAPAYDPRVLLMGGKALYVPLVGPTPENVVTAVFGRGAACTEIRVPVRNESE